MTQLRSELAVAQLPSRTDQIQAQAAQVAAARAALEQATWKLDQKAVLATKAGRVYDTLYREGEWVAGGQPRRADAAARERQGALLRPADDRRRARAGSRGGDPVRRLRRPTFPPR